MPLPRRPKQHAEIAARSTRCSPLNQRHQTPMPNAITLRRFCQFRDSLPTARVSDPVRPVLRHETGRLAKVSEDDPCELEEDAAAHDEEEEVYTAPSSALKPYSAIPARVSCVGRTQPHGTNRRLLRLLLALDLALRFAAFVGFCARVCLVGAALLGGLGLCA